MIHLTVGPTRSNYGVFTGIQIHARKADTSCGRE
jgi:hypothetical protein